MSYFVWNSKDIGQLSLVCIDMSTSARKIQFVLADLCLDSAWRALFIMANRMHRNGNYEVIGLLKHVD